ncbi:MAG: hypothetical protein SW833_19605, partial [Cyanobacteriota bacterium]|nr:hypothetical protein [Cyanobacteriota bacterium]
MSESIASQERRTQAFVGDSDPIKPWSVEQDADALMDDLFSDFERLLEGEMSLPGETVRPEPAPMPALTIPSMTGSLSPPTEEAIATEAQTDALLSVTQPDAAPLAPQSPPSKTSPSKGQKSNLHWDKLLLAFAGTALLGVLAWLALQEKLKLQQWWEQLITQVRGQPVTLLEATSVSASDAQFMTYMSRSLDLIERKVANSPPQNPNSGQSALPPAPGTSSAAGTVPQVIYNIYQPAPGLANGLLPAPSPAAPRAESQPAPPKPPAPAPEPETRSSAPPAPAPSAPTRPQAAAPAPP